MTSISRSFRGSMRHYIWMNLSKPLGSQVLLYVTCWEGLDEEPYLSMHCHVKCGERGSIYNYFVNGAWSKASGPWHLVAATALHGHARTKPVYEGSVSSPASWRKECVCLGLKRGQREQRSSSLECRVSGVSYLPSHLSEDSWKESVTRFGAQFPTKSVLYQGSTIFLITLPYCHL